MKKRNESMKKVYGVKVDNNNLPSILSAIYNQTKSEIDVSVTECGYDLYLLFDSSGFFDGQKFVWMYVGFENVDDKNDTLYIVSKVLNEDEPVDEDNWINNLIVITDMFPALNINEIEWHDVVEVEYN